GHGERSHRAERLGAAGAGAAAGLVGLEDFLLQRERARRIALALGQLDQAIAGLDGLLQRRRVQAQVALVGLGRCAARRRGAALSSLVVHLGGLPLRGTGQLGVFLHGGQSLVLSRRRGPLALLGVGQRQLGGCVG